MKKIAMLLLSSMLIVGSSTASVNAAVVENEELEHLQLNEESLTAVEVDEAAAQMDRESEVYRPMWTDTNWVRTNLSADGTTMVVSILIDPISNGTAVKGKVYLQEFSANQWVNFRYWNIDSVGPVGLYEMSKGTKGNRYRAKVVVNVGSDNIVVTSRMIDL